MNPSYCPSPGAWASPEASSTTSASVSVSPDGSVCRTSACVRFRAAGWAGTTVRDFRSTPWIRITASSTRGGGGQRPKPSGIGGGLMLLGELPHQRFPAGGRRPAPGCPDPHHAQMSGQVALRLPHFPARAQVPRCASSGNSGSIRPRAQSEIFPSHWHSSSRYLALISATVCRRLSLAASSPRARYSLDRTVPTGHPINRAASS